MLPKYVNTCVIIRCDAVFFPPCHFFIYFLILFFSVSVLLSVTVAWFLIHSYTNNGCVLIECVSDSVGYVCNYIPLPLSSLLILYLFALTSFFDGEKKLVLFDFL